MEEVISFFIAAFIALFTIMNPFSTALVFHSLSKGDSRKERIRTAKRASITAAVTLILFAFFGNYILDFFSVTIDAFKIAGGILIFGVGYSMVKGSKKHFSTEKEEKHANTKEDISIIPLAIPMLSGPGAMVTAIVLMEGTKNHVFSALSIILAIILVCILSYIFLRKANSIDKYLGETGVKVTDKILGLLVLVIGIQFVLNGLTGVINLWFG
jgi:multiple antibiotic resistance protein